MQRGNRHTAGTETGCDRDRNIFCSVSFDYFPKILWVQGDENMILVQVKISVTRAIVTGTLGLLACKPSSKSEPSEVMNGGVVWRNISATYFPYPGKDAQGRDCDPMSGQKCLQGNFAQHLVEKEWFENKDRQKFPQDKLGLIPAWGPHTFHCKTFRAPDSISYKQAIEQNANWKYYVAVTADLLNSSAPCGTVLRVKIKHKDGSLRDFRYRVTDYCPAKHAVQGEQAHCSKSNLDLSMVGLKEQAGVLDNFECAKNRPCVSFYVECKPTPQNPCNLPLGSVVAR